MSGPTNASQAGARNRTSDRAHTSLNASLVRGEEKRGCSAMAPRWASDDPIRIGVSSCLLGREVRYDGGHKRDRFLTDVLGPFVEWVPVCPEVEVGMGIPREPIRLVSVEGQTRLVAERSGTDHTDAMRAWAQRRLRQLEKLDLCGYVLKKASPSCGMERVRVYGKGAVPSYDGRGMFADELMSLFAALPIEEEGRLNDPDLRENFIERVFAYRRLRSLFAARWTRGAVVAFHAAHKLQVLAHSQRCYRELGRLVADLKQLPRDEFRQQYETGFMRALDRRATRRSHVNVLQHMLGYLRGRIGDTARRDLVEVIEDYANGLLPLIVPVTLFRHYVSCLGIEYLDGQVYLEPHPKELLLRNHV
jgi:uncharacterized protein YbgA (DUF1722 family)/uncharacterized protein YbbK (DUF523 family)